MVLSDYATIKKHDSLKAVAYRVVLVTVKKISSTNAYIVIFYRCTLHFDIYKVHTPTNALFIKLDKV